VVNPFAAHAAQTQTASAAIFTESLPSTSSCSCLGSQTLIIGDVFKIGLLTLLQTRLCWIMAFFRRRCYRDRIPWKG
jgi:hypothetical protein